MTKLYKSQHDDDAFSLPRCKHIARLDIGKRQLFKHFAEMAESISRYVNASQYFYAFSLVALLTYYDFFSLVTSGRALAKAKGYISFTFLQARLPCHKPPRH